ncbi:MAG TPA: hypothetical protein EYP65_06240, partial [Armatimonadetes bacterium]|nr:hypothetical protein [Armatimonadota bacterium]
MILKAIELFGFKTFAQRTRLDFGPGITAIVGPNGVGKTNLVEAFLWVLGETSARALRSTRSSDLIFNGSGGKRALSFAEVSLYLDNSEGLLPLPFSEVVITRRVLKSGESQYLLNGSPCRARDILPLLAEVGLSKNSLVVLTQGELEAVLSQRPKDRRALLESIAGAARYKIRREEALSKLEGTKANIERLSDIIAEVESQLAHLSEQAEKAERYLELVREREELRATLLARELLSAKQRRERAEREAQKVRAELEGVREEARSLEAEIERLKAKWEAARGEAESLRLLASEATLRAERIGAEATALRERLSSLQREGAEASQRGRRLREEVARLSSEVESLSKELRAREKTAFEAERSAKEAEEKARAISERANRKRAELEALSKKRLEAAKKVAALRNSLSSLEAELHRIEARRRDEKERLEGARRRMASLEKEADKANSEREALLEALERARKEVRELERETELARRRLAGAERALE